MSATPSMECVCPGHRTRRAVSAVPTRWRTAPNSVTGTSHRRRQGVSNPQSAVASRRPPHTESNASRRLASEYGWFTRFDSLSVRIKYSIINLVNPSPRSLHTRDFGRIPEWPSISFQRDIRIRTAEIRAAHGVRRGADGWCDAGPPGEGALGARGSIHSSNQGCLADESVSVELEAASSQHVRRTPLLMRRLPGRQHGGFSR